MQRFISVFLLISTSTIAAQDTVAQKIWAENVHGKPANRVLEDLRVIDMIAFTGMEKSQISPVAAAIASTLVRTCGFSPLRGPVKLDDMLLRASELAGRKITEQEIKDIAKLHGTVVSSYYKVNPPKKSNAMPMDITFGINDIRSLNRTVADLSHINEALSRISQLHGWGGQVYEIKNDCFPQLKEALDRGIPVLIECEQGIRVCFGYLRKDDHWLLLYALPKEMPLQVGRMPEAEEDRESLDPRIIFLRKDDALRFKGKFKADYQISATKQIPPMGFAIEPYEAGKFTAYVLMNWHPSAAAYDTEIRKVLNLSASASITPPAPIPDAPTDKELWGHYIQNKEEELGGSYILVPSYILPSGGNLNPQYAALISTVCTQRGVAVGKFSLNVNKLYKCACAIMGDEFLLPDGDKRSRMDALVAKLQAQYDLRQSRVSRDVENTSDPYMAAGLRMMAAMAPADTIEECLQEIEKFLGWKATVESKNKVPLDLYKKALFKRIPILLKPNEGNDWLVCIGYLRHHNEDFLILSNPQLTNKSQTLQIDNRREFPGPGVCFAKFSADQYTPYFIYDWQISADFYKPEIEDIFNGK